MDVETILSIYSIICLAVIGFNVLNIFASRVEPHIINLMLKIYSKTIEGYIERYKDGKAIGKIAAWRMRFSFRRTLQLTAFDNLISQIESVHEKEMLYDIIRYNYFIVYDITEKFLKESPIKTAYFLNLFYKYDILSVRPNDNIIALINKFLYKPSIYIRHNAFLVILKNGDPYKVADAINIINKADGYNHEKILSVGLMGFEGDSDKLISILLNNFDSYKTWIQDAICNYASIAGGAHKSTILNIMNDEGYSNKTRVFCIRYFGFYVYDKAFPYIIQYAVDTNPSKWEFAEMAVKTLSSYNCIETIYTLKDCLKSSNWNIKVDAAKALASFGVKYNDLLDIFNGEDRYAKEIMQYFLDMRKLRDNNDKEDTNDGRVI